MRGGCRDVVKFRVECLVRRHALRIREAHAPLPAQRTNPHTRVMTDTRIAANFVLYGFHLQAGHMLRRGVVCIRFLRAF